jgi:hypothetical protein
MDANSLSPVAFLFVVWFVLIFAVIGLVPYWKIFSKAGFSGWLSILMLVPLVNLVVLYLVAFSNWNVQPSFQQQVPPPPVLPRQRW